MGEIVVSGEGGMEFEVQERALQPTESKITADASSVLGWERFLPNMVVRVLLVEADDSTRQIIAALLRKCSYRVAAVPDGLKAWELLNRKAHNIDLILTEVELPSISGYALLTLIMEHDVCKNIPVIMMSSNDSMSTVYKCMLRGAADFLVKPLRKNELRNLWQHVWRKQTSSACAGIGPPPDESASQEKDEATAENNAISDHSNGYMSSIQRNKECNEKGSDAQSSCTKPELGTERGDNENIHLLSRSKRPKCLSSEIIEEYHQGSRKRQSHDNENGESQPVGNVDENSTIPRDGGKPANAITETGEAIDLIGTFGVSEPNCGTNKIDAFPSFDLLLRRSHYNGCINQVNDENHRLNHSDASPFSRYISNSLQPYISMLPNQRNDSESNSKRQPSKHDSETHDPTMGSPKQISVTVIRNEQPENVEICHPIPVRGVGFQGLINACSSAASPIYRTTSGPSPLPSPGIAPSSESLPQLQTLFAPYCQPSISQQVHSIVDGKIDNTTEQKDNNQVEKLEKSEVQGHVSPENDQGNNGNANHIQGTDSASNENTNAIPITRAPSEFGNEECFHVHEGSSYSHRSIQREAALTKFRLKRKDRCFEKKVRYESRKKLAEQRPRIKGQFVRQLPNDPQPGSSSTG